MTETALITGGAKGIGYEISKLFARDKYNLIIIGMDEPELKKKGRELEEKFGIEVRLIGEDLARPDAAEHVYNQLEGEKVDVLVNNAGFGLVGEFSKADWDSEYRMIQLQVVTLSRLTNLFMQEMIRRKQGKILNVSSVAAFYPGPYMAVYYATKAYILSFSEAIAEELKESGVTVTVLCPGVVKTGFQKSAGSKQKMVSKFNFMDSPEKVAEYGYKAMQKGKGLAVPGIITKLMVSLERILPRKTVTKIVGNLQKMNQD